MTMTGSPAAIARMISDAAQAYVAKADTSEDAEIAKALAEYEQIIKAKYNAEDKRKMAANGEAMKDESYPIKDAEDLEHAIPR